MYPSPQSSPRKEIYAEGGDFFFAWEAVNNWVKSDPPTILFRLLMEEISVVALHLLSTRNLKKLSLPHFVEEGDWWHFD